MVNAASLPSWRELLLPIVKHKRLEQNQQDNIWSHNSQKSFYFSKSSFALKAIVNIWKQHCGKDIVKICVPDFFCDEAVSQIRQSDVIISFYPVNDALKSIPDFWNGICQKNKPDIVLLVHYFGIENEDNNIISYCKQNGVLLVEDAAHVLRQSGGIGKIGGMTFYSPHKTLPVMQGSVLVVNEKNYIFKNWDVYLLERKLGIIVNEYEEQGINVRPNKWIVKKALQKVMPQSIACVSREQVATKCFDKEYPCLSEYSYVCMKNFSVSRLERIEFKRRENFRILSGILKNCYGINMSLQLKRSDVPFCVQIYVEDSSLRNLIYNKMNITGRFCYKWPLLPDDIDGDSHAYHILEKELIICVHEDMPIKKIVKNMKKDFNNEKVRKIQN